MSSTKSRIAVVGATGRVGHHIVAVLEEQGHDVVPISRATGVDVITGEGLSEALEGVEAVVDAATGPSPEQGAATAFFTTAAENLQRAGAAAGVGRIVVVSIVGTDRFSGGYGAAKVAHEQAHLAGPVPVRIVRATQFHELVGQLLAWGRQGDVARVPTMRTQPVAARAVAEVVADVATDPDGPQRADVAGPREERLIELARTLAERQGDPARVEETPTDADDPDDVLNADGGLLPGPGAILAGPTFAAWIAQEVAVA